MPFSRWLVPGRVPSEDGGLRIEAHLTEALVPEGSKADGMLLRDVEAALDEAEAQIAGLVRRGTRVPAPSPFREIRQGDILVIVAEPEGLVSALSALGLRLAEDRPAEGDGAEGGEEEREEEGADGTKLPDGARQDGIGKDRAGRDGAESGVKGAIRSGEVELAEYVVLPDSRLAGRSAAQLHLRRRHGINLLAPSRQGRRTAARLRNLAIRVGDVLLMQGRREALEEFAAAHDCVPLAGRALRIPDRARALTATAVLVGAVGLAASGLLSAPVAFCAGVLAALLLRVVPPRSAYDAVDWPVIVMLAALIPVSGAFASTGTAELAAGLMLREVAQGQPVIALVLVLLVTMTLSDFMNNAATAAMMCPIALVSAQGLGVNPDTFLMAVAVGASCAFLTPIGHQNNTLMLGRSGFRFGDYWRLGLPLEAIVVTTAIPMLLWAWPLSG